MIPHWKEKAPPPVSTNMNIITPPQKCWSIIAMFHHNNKYLLVWYYLCKFVCMCLHAFFHLSIYLPQSLSSFCSVSVRLFLPFLRLCLALSSFSVCPSSFYSVSSFIHYGDLYSASSRLLLRSAPDPCTAKKKY